MFADTISDVLALFRSEVDDVVSENSDESDRLWKTSELLIYATEAADATARAVLSLTEQLSLTVTSGTATLALPARVLHIRHAHLVTAKRILEARNLNELEAGDMFDSAGTPSSYVADYVAHSLQLFPTPSANDTLLAQCSTTISEMLSESDDTPFVDAQDIRLMLTYMKHLAYQKHDAETLDLERSRTYFDTFLQESRTRSASVRNYRRRPGTVRVNW